MSPIEWLVDRMNVGTPDSEVEADIRARAERGGVSPELVDGFVAEALDRHHRNLAEYRWVRGGLRGDLEDYLQ